MKRRASELFETITLPNGKKKCDYTQCRQNTPEWLKLRSDFALTASEVAQAIGVHKSATALTLYHLKSQQMVPTVSNYVQQMLDHGKTCEPIALKEFSEKTGIKASPTGIWPFNDKLMIGASPDSIGVDDNGEKFVVEVKCPYMPNFNFEEEAKCMNPAYYVQMQTQMACVNVKYGYYVIWTVEKMMINKVYFNQIAWDYILKEAEKFTRQVRERRPPVRNRSKAKKIDQIKIFQSLPPRMQQVYFAHF